MNYGSLFSGIGGMDLGLDRSGMQCKWQVEIDPFARRVLAKHWPDVPKHDDVKTFPPGDPEDWRVDLIAGGFPCQDISFAGKGAGLEGERSGLWYEFSRVIREIRPRFVLVENVPALIVRGLDAVLGTLASIGYDAEWECLPAASFGAPHLRDRIFVLAYSDGHYGGTRGQGRPPRVDQGDDRQACREETGDSRGQGPSFAQPERAFRGPVTQSDWWASEPDVVRVVHGVPSRVDRIGGLGNAVVPQVSEWLGRRILESASPGSVA